MSEKTKTVVENKFRPPVETGKVNFYSKLYEVQHMIGAIKKDSDNPYFKSKYFDINGLLAVIKPCLYKVGLVVLQPIVIKDGRNAIETAIMDPESSESFTSVIYLPEVADPQKFGSAITYYRRYALQSLLALEAEDDDGNSSSGKVGSQKPTITKALPLVEPDRPPFGPGSEADDDLP